MNVKEVILSREPGFTLVLDTGEERHIEVGTRFGRPPENKIGFFVVAFIDLSTPDIFIRVEKHIFGENLDYKIINVGYSLKSFIKLYECTECKNSGKH